MSHSPSQHGPGQTTETPEGEFDPLHKWLGIPPEEQPPNHYRLLAIKLFEEDADVIEAAANGRMSYVRQCAIGPHADASQKVLNNLSEAQLCLLSLQKKAAYDTQLRKALDTQDKNTADSSNKKDTAKSTTDPKLQQQLQKLDKQKKQIEALLEKCEFASAVGALEKMAAVKSPKLAKYAKWAKQQLPKAKRGTKEMRESSAAMYRTADELFEHNNYEEAAEILQQIPKKFRTPEARELLQECLDLQEEIVSLQEDIDHAEALNKYQDLQPTVERLLEIKPADRRARRLLKELKAYGKGGRMRLGGKGDGRFDAAGNTSNPIKTALLIIVPLIVFGAVSWATVVYIKSNNQTIKIEIDDPTAKVIIDDDTVKITGVGDTITLKPGMHELVVERGDIVVHTRDFEVIKGNNPVLKITLSDMQEGVASTPGDDSPTVAGNTGDIVATVPSAPANQQPVPIPQDTDVEITRIFQGHTDSIDNIAISPDGKLLLSHSRDESVRLWDIDTGRELRRLAHDNRPLKFTSDGKFALTGDFKNKTLNLWDVQTGKAKWVVNGQPASSLPGGGTCMSPDGRWIYLIQYNQGKHELTLLDTSTGKELRRLIPQGEERYETVTVSPDGSNVLVRSLMQNGDRVFEVWDTELKNQRSRHIFLRIANTPIGNAQFLSNNTVFSPMRKEKIAAIWNPITGNILRKLESFSTGRDGAFASLRVSKDGRFAAIRWSRGYVTLWNIEIGTPQMVRIGDNNYTTQQVEFLPDSNRIVSVGNDRNMMLWKLPQSASTDAGPKNPARMTLKEHTDAVTAIEFTSDGSRFVSGSFDKSIKVWDAAKNSVSLILRGHTGRIYDIALSPDETQIVSASEDKTVKLWNAKTGEELTTLTGHDDDVTCVAFSPDGNQIVSGSEDKLVKLWDVASGKVKRTLRGHKYAVRCVAFKPDGNQVVSGGDDYELKFWGTRSGRLIRTIGTERLRIYSVCFSPDGEQLVSAGGSSSRGIINIWDASSGQAIKSLDGHAETVRSIAFSRNGNSIISGSSDKTIKLWDTASGDELTTLTGHLNGIGTVAISPKADWVVSGSFYGSVKLWDMTDDKTASFPPASPVTPTKSVAIGGSNSPDGPPAILIPPEVTVDVVRLFRGHTDSIDNVSVSPNNELLLSASRDGTTKLWELKTGREIKTIQQRGLPLIFTPDSRHALVGTPTDKTLQLWDIEADTVKWSVSYSTFSGMHGHAVVMTSDGSRIYMLAYNDESRLYDLILLDATTGKEIHKITQSQDAKFDRIAIARDNSKLLVRSYLKNGDLIFDLWDAELQNKLGSTQTSRVEDGPIGQPQFVTSDLVVGPFRKQRALASWDPQSGKVTSQIESSIGGTDGGFKSLKVSPDGHFAGMSWPAGKVNLWNLQKKESMTFRVDPLDEYVLDLEFLHDGEHAVIAGESRHVVLWKLPKSLARKR